MEGRCGNETVDRLLGDLEVSITRQMWTREVAAVRDVLEALRDGGRQVAYTTVMTVMGRLNTRGLLDRDLVGKTHVHRAAMDEEHLLRAAAARRVAALSRSSATSRSPASWRRSTG